MRPPGGFAGNSTRDPFRVPAILERYTREVDDVRRRYPDAGYRSDPAFRWQYPDYFGADATRGGGP